jgi:hypothetical protein
VLLIRMGDPGSGLVGRSGPSYGRVVAASSLASVMERSETKRLSSKGGRVDRWGGVSFMSLRNLAFMDSCSGFSKNSLMSLSAFMSSLLTHKS